MSTLSLPDPVIRKRCRLYTQAEIGAVLGVCRHTIMALERDPLSVHPSKLMAYLSVLGWRLGVYPVNKEG